MSDITPAEQARAIRWIQEKLVFIALAMAFAASIITSFSMGMMFMVAMNSSDEIENMNDEMEVYQIWIQKLDADLRSRGIEPPPLPEKDN